MVRAMKQVSRTILVSWSVLSACSSAQQGATFEGVEPSAGEEAALTSSPSHRGVDDDAPSSTAAAHGPEDAGAAGSPSAEGLKLAKSIKATPEQGHRIAAIGPHVWISPEPFTKEGLVALGNIRLGTSVKLKSPTPIPGDGCARGWYAIEPRGYVCLNVRTTLDMSDPYLLALRDVAPKRGELFPYRYAYSRGAPMYSRVPTPAEWKEAELAHGKAGTHAELGPWAAGHEELLEPYGVTATDEVPWYFEGGKRRVSGGGRSSANLVWKTIPNGSMLAFGRAFEMHGRVWLVTPDLTVVPADRVQPMRRSKFQGVRLENGVELPLAWNRGHEARPVYERAADGSFVATSETLGGKQWVMVHDKRLGSGKTGYHELKERPGKYVSTADVTLARKRKKLPPAIKPGEKWIDAHITPGTLTAYVGETPVFTTLFSPGKGGHPVPGLDHSRYATTQTGYFRYEWKEAVATMSNETGDPKVLWFSDVPHIQYIRAPLAMHVAYWHEDFANPKSAECVNLSPHDGRFMFEWTDPKLPEDWGAVRPGGGNGPSTPIMINGFWVE